MTCETIQERIVAALDEGFSDPEVDRHCETCPDCQLVRDGLQQTLIQLDDLPKPSLHQAEFLEARLAPGPAPGSDLIERLRLWWQSGMIPRPAFGLGLILLGLFLGYFLPRPSGSVPAAVAPVDTDAIGELAAEVAELRGSIAFLRLRQPSASARLQGVAWIERNANWDPGVVEALGQVLLSDENVNVRLAAIDALVRFGNEPEVRELLVESLAASEAPLVRIALIEALVPLAEPSSIPVFKAIVASEKSHEAVRARARAAIDSEI